MLITAKEYAAQKGLHHRTVRLHLVEGKIPGRKLADPLTGVEVWMVEIPDDPGPEETIPLLSEAILTGQGEDPDGAGGVPDGEGGSWKEMAQRLYQDNLELAGRCGFYQARIQELEQRVLELEAPKNEAVSGGVEGSLFHAREGLTVEYQDRDLTCADCGRVFLLTAGERGFYSKRGLVEPKRCSVCRTARRQQKKQTRAEHIQASICTDHAPAKMSNYPAPSENGAASGSQKVSSRAWWQFWR